MLIWGSGFGLISGPFWRRFRTHFWSLLEAVSGLILELIWSVERIPESTKNAAGIFEDPCPNLESFRCTLLRFHWTTNQGLTKFHAPKNKHNVRGVER